MTTKRVALWIGGCLGILGVLGSGIVSPSMWSSTSASPSGADRSQESTSGLPQGNCPQQGEAPANRVLLVSLDGFAGRLDRPPVKFDHDKHTAALQPGSCVQCHAKNAMDEFVFTYPKLRDETSRKALMHSFHDSCIGCHEKRLSQGKGTGPTACGECHALDREAARKVSVPVLPEYYEVLRDTYHRHCIACHREPAKRAEDAEPLDWQKFYLAQKSKTERQWPKVVFDYYLHDKHEKALSEKCSLCHVISPERQQKLMAEGRMPTGRDWVMDVDETNDFGQRKVAHARCINCHLQRKVQGFPTGPVFCGECHTGVQRTVEQMADVPRPKCDVDEKMLLRREHGARAKAVAFNHASHVAKSRSCQDCHHKTLRACDECHTEKGSEHGGWVTLAEAHHRPWSPLSCVGCHEKEKDKPDCAGCHETRQRGLVQTACSGCHTGSLDRLHATAKLPSPEELLPADTKPKILLSELENEYGPSPMPHLAIAKRLTDVSNNHGLARHFHQERMTICAGCHHYSPLEAKTPPPPCSTCHTARHEPTGKMPTLLGAYHQQCLGCHRAMDPLRKDEKNFPQSCTGCHEEKALKQIAANLRD